MKLFNRLSHGIGLLLFTAVWLTAADRASAVFTLAGTPAELIARGISADFETPAQARADTESTSTNNIGAGWTMNLISGISNNYGVADPAIAFYNTAAGNPSPLPSPFEGFQFGFFNLNNWYSQGEIVSNPIGRLQSGQTYTLNVAVGARNSTAQDQVAYRVGLRASDGTDLGTFSLATLVPSASATNISDLTYTLDTSTIPGSFIGKPVRVVIGGYNTGLNSTGTPTDQLAQPNFDNVRLSGTFDDLITQAASLTINRQTGGITLANTGSANVNIVGYSLTSAAGSLNQLQWTRIGSPLAQMSANGSATDLSEASLQGGSVSFSTSSPISLGSAWYKTPYQDIQAQVLLDDGTKLTPSVSYSGTAIASGDLNADGIINVADWTVFKSGSGTSFTGLSKAQSYPKGDMNGDLKHDLNDFQLFRAAFNAVNGAGAFETMSAVPEPATALLLSSGSLFVFAKMRRRAGRSTTRSTVGSRTATAAIVALAFSALLTAHIRAQTTLAHWTFDPGSLTTNPGNITGVADATGTHNATTTNPAGGT